MAIHQQVKISLDNRDYLRDIQRTMAATEAAGKYTRQRIDTYQRSLMRGGTGAGGNGSGGMAVQIQDIAVQLQSGTKLATIIAQQGSQMASVFGPGGAVVGAGIAIGGLLYTISQGSEKAGKAAKELGRDFAAAAADASGLATSLAKAVTVAESLGEEGKNAAAGRGTWKGVLDTLAGGVGVVFGGPTRKEKQDQIARDKRQLAAEVQLAQRRLVELAEEDLAVAVAKSSLDESAAAKLEAQVTLRRKLATIEGMQGVDRDTKDQLSAIAIQRRDAEINIELGKRLKEISAKRLADEKELASVIERNVARQDELAEAGKTNQQKLADVNFRLAEKKPESWQGPLAKANYESRMIDFSIRKANIEKQIADERERIDAKHARMQEDEFLRLDRIEKKMREMNDLRTNLMNARQAEFRQTRYDQGDYVLETADKMQMSGPEKAALARQKRSRKRAERRAAERIVDMADIEERKTGGLGLPRVSGLSSQERKKRIAELIRKAEEAKRKEKIEAVFSPTQIQEIVKQIADLQAK